MARAEDDEGWRLTGHLLEKESGRPLPGLLVSAFDKDLFADDPLGMAVSDREGRFEIRYTTEQFRDLFESSPDLYLKVYNASGEREIFSTRERVRSNAERHEKFQLRIPAANLEGTSES